MKYELSQRFYFEAAHTLRRQIEAEGSRRIHGHTYIAEITTNFGVVHVTLNASVSPLTVNSFVNLARFHYFDGTTCHRAIKTFVVQCGDPTATGSGGPLAEHLGLDVDDAFVEASRLPPDMRENVGDLVRMYRRQGTENK